MKRVLILIFVGLLAVGCGSKKRIVTKKKNSKHRTERVVVKTSKDDPRTQAETPSEIVVDPNDRKTFANSTEAYIHEYKDIAQEEMRRYGIPASITLAQGILESASGQARLAVEGNNHFGIKCHNWTGGKIYHDDDARQECFRTYKHARESFEDHSLFLSGRSRYAKLFQLDIDDYKGWAKGLRAAGYATDRKYPEKLIGLIERFELYRYDEAVLGSTSREAVKERPKESLPDAMTHRVAQGDTLYNISKRYNITVEHLKRLNRLSDNAIAIGQVLRVK